MTTPTFTSQITNTAEIPLVRMGEMKPAQIGVIVGGPYDGHIVMKSPSTEVEKAYDLSCGWPDSCWTLERNPGIKVRIFPAGTQITITVR